MIRSKTITMSLSAALIVGMIGVTGCGTKNTDNQNLRTKSVKYNTNSINQSNLSRHGINTANNDRGLITRSDNRMMNLRYSEELSSKIAKMKQVDMAKVMLTGENAYVAVSIKDHNTLNGTTTNLNNTDKVRTGINSMGINGNRNNVGAPSITGSGSNMRNQTGANYSTTNETGYGTMGTGADGLMRGLTSTPRTMNEPVSGEDQYMTKEVKDMIADVIKKSDTNIKNVYVSANPDFVDRVGNFVTDVSNGHPISGIVDEFQTLVNRIFPTPSGNINTTNDHRPMNNLGR
ncbi:YhcN/YlaJ family sporulation lipoprotein [Paenibacillus sp. FA6]|uniref:YhcN/YlaJ family sporulation lipoprotein n=1 Tax=Paenibacillus sp. FA6 TaxID=3413029 RepID=UPI003F6585E0